MDSENHLNIECLNDELINRKKLKERKKIEGRKRAIEIAKDRQREKQKSDGNHCNTSDDTTKSRRSRHGARNQHRHKHFVRWLAQNFPHVFESCKVDNIKNLKDEPNSEDGKISHILDVAGGKGELSARLSMCYNCQVVMVDPRLADICSCFEKDILKSLPKKWQERISSHRANNADYIAEIAEKRFNQLVMNFDQYHVDSNSSLLEAVQNCKLIIGLHADGATEAIVDVALAYHKPFVVVPCCVFPNLFRDRKVMNEETGKFISVRNHDQFCQYLKMKDSHFRQDVLPFEGRNVAIWWDGKHSDM
mmetsp:Transcript_17678/g.24933  ORF Transcript_17678/g.24933 Transcript_17678/m.24933 type:complete len:306 (+) Transcript_17678:38-955(+)